MAGLPPVADAASSRRTLARRPARAQTGCLRSGGNAASVIGAASGAARSWEENPSEEASPRPPSRSPTRRGHGHPPRARAGRRRGVAPVAGLRRCAPGRGMEPTRWTRPTTVRTRCSSRTRRSCTATSPSSPDPVPTSANPRPPAPRSRARAGLLDVAHRATRHPRRRRRPQARRHGLGRARRTDQPGGPQPAARSSRAAGRRRDRGPGHQGAAPQVRRHRAPRRHRDRLPPARRRPDHLPAYLSVPEEPGAHVVLLDGSRC